MSATDELPSISLTLESWQGQLTPEAARAILALRAEPRAQARYDELASKCNAGSLNDAERRELDATVEFNDLVSLFKAHAATVVSRG